MSNLEGFFETKELVLSHASLMHEIEQLPPGTNLSPVKKRKAARLEKELNKKLFKHLLGDPFPVIKKEAL